MSVEVHRNLLILKPMQHTVKASCYTPAVPRNDVAPLPANYVRLHVLMPDEEGLLQLHLAKVRWPSRDGLGLNF